MYHSTVFSLCRFCWNLIFAILLLFKTSILSWFNSLTLICLVLVFFVVCCLDFVELLKSVLISLINFTKFLNNCSSYILPFLFFLSCLSCCPVTGILEILIVTHVSYVLFCFIQSLCFRIDYFYGFFFRFTHLCFTAFSLI